MSRNLLHALSTALLSCVALAACNERAQVPSSPAPAIAKAKTLAKAAAPDECEARRARHDQQAGGRIVAASEGGVAGVLVYDIEVPG